jgi:predicted small secreted protein
MKYLMALLAAVCMLAMAGCNTMEGAGKDVASGGRAIQDASRKVRAEWREARDRNEREYDAARRTCAGTAGADREACMDRAHAQYGTRMKDARTTYHRSDMRAESEEDRREDAYDAAREKCEALRGADEDRCMADVRSRYAR